MNLRRFMRRTSQGDQTSPGEGRSGMLLAIGMIRFEGWGFFLN
jgi:hypothetical protein